MKNIHFDELFSYWIFFWFLFYFCYSFFYRNTLINNYFNPLFALCIGLLNNLTTLFIIFIFNYDIWIIVYYIFMIFLVKIIPIYLLRNSKINWLNDSMVFVIIFIIYNFYLFFVKKTDIFRIYILTYISLVTGQSKTPLYSLIKSIKENIRRQ
jgi:hypothetical protein